MSFTFGFAGDDIEDDGTKVDNQTTFGTTANGEQDLIQPQSHKFEDLLSSLPSQLSFNSIVMKPLDAFAVPLSLQGSVMRLQRRSLFDIRAQLMAEANPEENEHDILLAGLEAGDLSSGMYEGGFKTWECSIDLAQIVSSLRLKGEWHIIELGAGSAIPSLAILTAFLHESTPTPDDKIHFTLCDYNAEVLRLATAPNVFLNYYAAMHGDQIPTSTPDHDLDLEELDHNLVTRTSGHMRSQGVTIDLVSGAWGSDFVTTIQNHQPSPSENLLILASETIYSPESTCIFTQTLMSLLSGKYQSATALVATKKVYFGVGGGVEDFVNQLTNRGGQVQRRTDTSTTGVGRVVLEITKAGKQSL